MTNHYQKLEKMYLSANVNTKIYTSTTCKIKEGESNIGLVIEDKYFHALGAIHGSVYFKLLDDAAFFAVNSIVKDAFVLTTNFTIKLIRPVNNGKIEAKGFFLGEENGVYTAKSELRNELGKIVAIGSGSFVKSKIKLTPEIGYE